MTRHRWIGACVLSLLMLFGLSIGRSAVPKKIVIEEFGTAY